MPAPFFREGITMEESQVFSIADGGHFTNAMGDAMPTHRFVSFRFEAVENIPLSRDAGRPVFDRVLVVRQHYPGDKSTLDRNMLRWPAGSDRFVVEEPDHWPFVRDIAEKWMANQQEAASGTPLALLNLRVDEIAGLRAAGVGSIEMLAQVPDGALKAISGARELRDRAQRFLTAADAQAPLEQAEARAQAAQEEVEGLRERVAELEALVRRSVQEREEPRRGGRPAAAKKETV